MLNNSDDDDNDDDDDDDDDDDHDAVADAATNAVNFCKLEKTIT